MGRQRYTRELYEKLLDAFKQAPGNVSRAAITAGTGRDLAKRAWEKGFKTKHLELPAIASVMNDLEAEARSRLADEEAERSRKAAEMRAKAREDAIKAAAEEAAGSRAARVANAGQLQLMGRLLESTVKLVNRMRQESDLLADAAPGKFKWKQSITLLTRIAVIVEKATKGHMWAMQQERLRIGSPMAIVGLSTEQMQPEAGPIEFGDIERTLARARELGLIPPATSGEEAGKKVH